MGLDLILKSRNKEYYGNDDWHELAYGRKTWTIADFFRDRNEAIDGDWCYHVTRESWDEFIGIIATYATNPDFLAALKRYNEGKEENGDFDILSAPGERLSGDGWFQLGPEWEAAAIMRWYNANFEVQEAFNRGDEIRLIVSY